MKKYIFNLNLSDPMWLMLDSIYLLEDKEMILFLLISPGRQGLGKSINAELMRRN